MVQQLEGVGSVQRRQHLHHLAVMLRYVTLRYEMLRYVTIRYTMTGYKQVATKQWVVRYIALHAVTLRYVARMGGKEETSKCTEVYA